MTALEQFVMTVRNLSASGSLDNLYDFCIKSHELLSNNLQLLDDVLATLSLQEHSMGILSVLIVKMKSVSSVEEHDLILPRVKEFIEGSSVDQIRVASDLFATLCHLYTNLMIEDGRAIKGINTIMTGIEKVQVHVNQLTSIHSDVCLLSLTSKCLKPVLQRILCHDINDISKENGHFDVKYFLLYYYYGGMIYAAVKDFDRALIFFEAALTTQSMAVSHIMIESYKKYVLISLIVYGKVMPLPKYTPQVVSRFIRGFCDPYINIAQSYSSNNPEEVKAVITKHQTVFQSDKNEGLVKQVLNSLHKKNIQRLTKTFLTLSLTDVSSRVFLENEREAEDRVVRMIESDDIFAVVNQKDGMVVFLDNPEKYHSAKMFNHLQQLMKKCVEADEQLKRMDQEIAVSSKYIQKLRVHDND